MKFANTTFFWSFSRIKFFCLVEVYTFYHLWTTFRYRNGKQCNVEYRILWWFSVVCKTEFRDMISVSGERTHCTISVLNQRIRMLACFYFCYIFSLVSIYTESKLTKFVFVQYLQLLCKTYWPIINRFCCLKSKVYFLYIYNNVIFQLLLAYLD